MSYAHYWSREFEFEREAFNRFSEDVEIVIKRAEEMGIKLAGPSGSGKPLVGHDGVAFNGSIRCGHRYRDLGKPFAAPDATGVEECDPPYDPKAEPWLSGPYLKTRVCGGTCAGEAFVIDRKYLIRDWERPEAPGIYGCSCETSFKPYDLIVTAVLIRAKERLQKAITVSTENPGNGFEDARRLCRELFGWSDSFQIEIPHTEMF